MSEKPDATQLKRATVQLGREHKPRRLEGFSEVRLCRADEEAIVDDVRRRERAAKQANSKALIESTEDIASRV